MCGKEGDWTGVNDTYCRGDDQPRSSSKSFSSSWSFPTAAAAAGVLFSVDILINPPTLQCLNLSLVKTILS